MQLFLKKLSHIWDYYKVPIIGIPLIFLLIAYVFISFSSPDEESFSIYIINQELSLDNAKLLTESTQTALSSPHTPESVLVEHSLYINRENSDPDSQMVFTASISAHTIDVMISDVLFLEQYAPMEALLDLTELLPETDLQRLSPFLLEAPDGNGESKIYGIDVSSCSFLQDCSFDAPVLTIAKYSEHRASDIDFIRLLFDL